MLVSMMERADRRGVIRQSLLINHRAYGGLQQLASRLFYQKNMISGHQEELFPPSVSHIQRYLERFLNPGQKLREPRLLAYDTSRSESRVGTSWFNQRHIDWVMQRVSELLPDPMFRQVGKDARGTILIISPYKESYMKYRKAIKSLPASWQTRLNVQGRVEARTVDTVQGGEADFVFLDFVRSEASSFLDDPNRLNVALTRARQGEIIMMHPGSKDTSSNRDYHLCVLANKISLNPVRRYTNYLSQVFDHCDAIGQVVEINQQAPRPMASAPDENERQAYQRHVADQRKFDNERVAYGLQPNNGEESGGLGQPAQNGEDPLEEENALESIFTAQIVGLAGMIERILAENKAKEWSEKSRENTQNQHARQQASPSPVAAPTSGRTLISAVPLAGALASVDYAKKGGGLMQTRRSLTTSASALTSPNGHHDSEDMIQFSPNEKGPGLFGPQSQVSSTAPSTVSPIFDGQGSSAERHTSATADGANGVDQDDVANSAPKSSTPAYWW